MEITKLNKTFTSEQVLTAEEMNLITSKIDEVIEPINNPTPPAGGYNRALYEAAGAVFNEDTGFYELHGLKDITEEQMDCIYEAGFVNFNMEGAAACWYYNNKKIRTHLTVPLAYYRGKSYKNDYVFYGCSLLEVAYVGGNIFKDSREVFKGCSKLRKILSLEGQIGAGDNSYPTTSFDGLYELEEITSYRSINKDTSFKDCPKLNYKTFQQIINWKTGQTTVTITVHPTTYSYLTGEAEPTEQVGSTAEEWQALLTSALDKQITFVSA